MTTEFIPVITNTQEVQWRRSPAQKFFLAFLERLRARGPLPALDSQLDDFQDAQGFYILGPDGTPYGWINDADPEDVLRFMNGGLRQWREHPPATVKVSASEIAEPWTTTPLPETQVVRVYARIRPLPARVWGLNRGIGRDQLWIYPEDTAALIAASAGGPQTPVELPPALVGRILRFHLTDDVRGTPDLWNSGEVVKAELFGRVISQVGAVRTLSIAGDFAMRRVAKRWASGTLRPAQEYAGRLEGEIELDVAARRILRFRALSDGNARGASIGTPYPPPGKFRLLVALVEAAGDDELARIVPPEAITTHGGDDRHYRAAVLSIRPGPARPTPPAPPAPPAHP